MDSLNQHEFDAPYPPSGWKLADPQDEFEDICNVLSEPPVLRTNRRKHKLLDFAFDIDLRTIVAHEEAALVRGLIWPGNIGVIYGASGDGKTFGALDMGLHVALGITWHGFKVRKTPVLMVTLEGKLGFKKRYLANAKKIGDPGKFFAVLSPDVSLVQEKRGSDGAKIIIEAAKELMRITGADNCLIIIDTLARATAGEDENDTKIMTGFVENRLAHIVRETGATVCVIHHTNKAGGMRGSSVLRASSDFVFRIDRDGTTNRRSLTAEKVKDGEEQPIFKFELEQVRLDHLSDGEPVTSCVLNPVAGTGRGRQTRCYREAKRILTSFYATDLKKRGKVKYLASSRHAREHFIGNFLHDNQAAGLNFTVAEFMTAVGYLNGSFIEQKPRKVRGKKEPSMYWARIEPDDDGDEFNNDG